MEEKGQGRKQILSKWPGRPKFEMPKVTSVCRKGHVCSGDTLCPCNNEKITVSSG